MKFVIGYLFLNFNRLTQSSAVLVYASFELNYWNYSNFITCLNCERLKLFFTRFECVCIPISALVHSGITLIFRQESHLFPLLFSVEGEIRLFSDREMHLSFLSRFSVTTAFFSFILEIDFARFQG